MIYIWSTPIKFLECEYGDNLDKYVGRYNRDRGPDSATLNNGYADGKLWGWTKNDLEFKFDVSILELLAYDVLENDASIIIVNHRIRAVFEKFAKDDVQFVPIVARCINGTVDGYFAVNILSRVSGIDKNKSKIEWEFIEEKYIAGFNVGSDSLVYDHDCMGNHNIALEKEFPFILVSQDLRDALISVKPAINEIRLVLPEEIEW